MVGRLSIGKAFVRQRMVGVRLGKYVTTLSGAIAVAHISHIWAIFVSWPAVTPHARRRYDVKCPVERVRVKYRKLRALGLAPLSEDKPQLQPSC